MEHRCNLNNLRFRSSRGTEQDGDEINLVWFGECPICDRVWKIMEHYIMDRIDYLPEDPVDE